MLLISPSIPHRPSRRQCRARRVPLRRAARAAWPQRLRAARPAAGYDAADADAGDAQQPCRDQLARRNPGQLMHPLYRIALLIPPIRRLHEARDQLLQERDTLAAQTRPLGSSPLYHYNTCFDAEAVLRIGTRSLTCGRTRPTSPTSSASWSTRNSCPPSSPAAKAASSRSRSRRTGMPTSPNGRWPCARSSWRKTASP